MAQITLYIDDETSASMRAAAAAAGVSLSKWVAALVRAQTNAAWPADVVALAGAWREGDVAAPDRASQPSDVPREALCRPLALWTP